MKYITQFVVAIALFGLPVTSFAFAGDAPRGRFDPLPKAGEPAEFAYGQPVVIVGENLTGRYDFAHGSLPLERQICFTSEVAIQERTCFDSEDPRVIQWTSGTIVVEIPEDAYARGDIRLRFKEFNEDCATVSTKKKQITFACLDAPTWKDETEIGAYVISPIIKEIINKDMNEPASAIAEWTTYEIRGAWFGNSKGYIYVDDKQAYRDDTISWTPTSIVFRPTNVSGMSVRVQSALKKSPPFTFHKPVMTELPITMPKKKPAKVVIHGYSDVKMDNDYYPAIAWATNYGIVSGYPNGTFRPNNSVTRAEFLKIILEAVSAEVGYPSYTPFTDVVDGAWYTPYITYGMQMGIVQGYPDGTFRPDQPVSFAEALKMAYTTFKIHTQPTSGEWYAPYVSHAKKNDVLFENSINPGSNIKRKDVVWIVWKLLHMVAG